MRWELRKGGDYTTQPAGLRQAMGMLYQYYSSRNDDPSRDLEKITARVLAINSADDFVNPPELGVVEQLMPRVKNGRFISRLSQTRHAVTEPILFQRFGMVTSRSF